MHTGQVILALAILLPLAGLLVRAGRKAQRARSGQARPKAGGGIVSGWFQHRRDKALENARHYNGMLREAARHRHRLTEQEHAAKVRASARGGGPAGDTGDFSGPDGGARPPRQTVIGRVIRLGKQPAAPGAPAEAQPPSEPYRRRTNAEAEAERAAAGKTARPDGPPGTPGDGVPPRPPQSPEPPARGAEESAPPGTRPAPGHPELPARAGATAPRPVASPTLEGVVVTTPALNDASAEAVPGVAQVVEGLRLIAGHAMAGNIQAKRRAVLALVYVARRCAATALTLARFMGEPGRHYGIEVTERVGAMAMHFTGAASAGTEADATLLTLLHASVAESMAAGRQMPHHDELQESGTY